MTLGSEALRIIQGQDSRNVLSFLTVRVGEAPVTAFVRAFLEEARPFPAEEGIKARAEGGFGDAGGGAGAMEQEPGQEEPKGPCPVGICWRLGGEDEGEGVLEGLLARKGRSSGAVEEGWAGKRLCAGEEQGGAVSGRRAGVAPSRSLVLPGLQGPRGRRPLVLRLLLLLLLLRLVLLLLLVSGSGVGSGLGGVAGSGRTRGLGRLAGVGGGRGEGAAGRDAAGMGWPAGPEAAGSGDRNASASVATAEAARGLRKACKTLSCMVAAKWASSDLSEGERWSACACTISSVVKNCWGRMGAAVARARVRWGQCALAQGSDAQAAAEAGDNRPAAAKMRGTYKKLLVGWWAREGGNHSKVGAVEVVGAGEATGEGAHSMTCGGRPCTQTHAAVEARKAPLRGVGRGPIPCVALGARSMWAARLGWAQGYRRRGGSTRGRCGTGLAGAAGWGRQLGCRSRRVGVGEGGRVRQAVVGRGGPAGATRGAGGVALIYAAEVQGVRTRGPTERGSRPLFKVVDGAKAHGTRRGVLDWRQRRPVPEPVWRGWGGGAWRRLGEGGGVIGIDGLGHRGRRRDGGGKVDGRVGRGTHWQGAGALNGGGGRWAGGRPEAWQARVGTPRQGGRRPRKRVGTGNAEGV
eukprot:s59_g42.t1